MLFYGDFVSFSPVFMHLPYRPKFRLDGHNDSVMALDFSPSGSKLVSVGIDGRLFIWSMSSGQELFRYDACFSRGFSSVVWLDDTRVIAGMEDGVLVLLTRHGQVRGSRASASNP